MIAGHALLAMLAATIGGLSAPMVAAVVGPSGRRESS